MAELMAESADAILLAIVNLARADIMVKESAFEILFGRQYRGDGVGVRPNQISDVRLTVFSFSCIDDVDHVDLAIAIIVILAEIHFIVGVFIGVKIALKRMGGGK